MTRSWYPPASGSGAILALVDAAPAATNLVTGWRFANQSDTTGIGLKITPHHNVLLGPSSFVANANEPQVPPFTDGVWRTPSAYVGELPATTWTLNLRLRAFGGSTSASQRSRWRVFRGRAVDGSDGVELTAAVIVGDDTGQIANGTQVTATASWVAPAIPLDGEYLFFSLMIEARSNPGQTGTGSGNTRDTNIVAGATSVFVGPDMLPLQTIGAVRL